MTRDKLLATIRDMLAEILDNDSVQITEATTADTVEDWDSINHVKLLIALEREFGIRFGSDEVKGLANVGEMIDVLQAKLQK